MRPLIPLTIALTLGIGCAIEDDPADVDAASDDLQAQLDELRADLAELEETVAGHGSQLSQASTELDALELDVADNAGDLDNLALSAQRINFVDNEKLASEVFDVDQHQGEAHEVEFRIPDDVRGVAEAVYLAVDFEFPSTYQGDDFSISLRSPSFLDAKRVCRGNSSGQTDHNGDHDRCHVWLEVDPTDDRHPTLWVSGIDGGKQDGNVRVEVSLLGYLESL